MMSKETGIGKLVGNKIKMTQEEWDLMDDLLDEPCKECGVKGLGLGAYRKDETDTMWVECFECGYEYDSNIK